LIPFLLSFFPLLVIFDFYFLISFYLILPSCKQGILNQCIANYHIILQQQYKIFILPSEEKKTIIINSDFQTEYGNDMIAIIKKKGSFCFKVYFHQY